MVTKKEVMDYYAEHSKGECPEIVERILDNFVNGDGNIAFPELGIEKDGCVVGPEKDGYLVTFAGERVMTLDEAKDNIRANIQSTIGYLTKIAEI